MLARQRPRLSPVLRPAAGPQLEAAGPRRASSPSGGEADLLLFIFLAALAGRAGGEGLRDAPLAADALQGLDGVSWSVTAPGIAPFGAAVPGDLITDMQLAGLVGDPLVELNFLEPLWDVHNFTYATQFDLAPDVAAQATQLLVLDGVKMVADVSLNGVALGIVDNAFLRFVYDVTPLLRRGAPNVLAVAFTTSNDTRNTPGRWAAASGGWDWAPISNTMVSPGDPYGDLATFTKGIWKSVYVAVVAATSAAIEHVVPHVFYLGDYPTAPLTDANHGDFAVRVKVVMRAPAAVKGVLTATGSWGGANSSASLAVTLAAGVSGTVLTLAAIGDAARL